MKIVAAACIGGSELKETLSGVHPACDWRGRRAL